ncbi:hypothetical protein F2Q69_00016838 [Brassica cretica]|uniref:NUP160 helical domain-containing protein n=1 Tax=Brassica cretica TaxID=69181 RepID=A0A8S9R5F1_BRACR|nr:hypothetical protein F2Q69_00016838 [Brassica cretica]
MKTVSIIAGVILSLGIFDNVALRLTLRNHNKRWSDSEFQSLSLDELKSEILLLIEQEIWFLHSSRVTGESTISVFHWWENFCSTYLGHWRNNNEPRTLLVQSDGIGLIRNKSVSLFFSLKKAEHSLGGLSSEHSNLTSLGSEMSHSEHEILLEVLNCTLKISKQLGTAPYAMYFESVTGKPVISSDETFGGLVNILESGYDMFIGQRTWSDLCADISREKELKSHENLRTFSIDMLLSLSTLCQKAGSWEKVFTNIENHLQHRLVPKKFRYNNNGEALSDICSSILVQATSQFAKVMFESAFDIVLLLSYLLNISAQVSMSQQDISKLRLKLLPMIQDIVSQWLIILFFVNTPTSVDDCSFKLSSLQIDSSIDKKSWNKMLGKCGFSLAYILLFSDHRRCIVDSQFNLRYLPDSEITTSLVQNFVSWICYSKTGEDSSSLLRRSSELTLRLIRNGQADAVEDGIMGFISSIFLGRLLCLGIFDNVALRLTLRDHNKRWSNSEFQSLSLDELKSEILLLIEQEVTGQTSISVFCWWERFCSTYLDHWRNNNEPRTLLVQSDVIGLVRNNSVSLFFRSENAERSHGGPSSEHSNLTSLGSGMSTDEHEILSEVLNCTLKISKQLGTAPYAMYFESVTGKSVISSEEILSRLVNILESGYAMSIGQRTWSDLGADRARESKLEAHRNLRRFSIDMLLSLSALCQRAGSWEKVFTIMEKYVQQHLVPKKFRHNNNGEALSDICSSILVQATSLFAKVMFESAFDIVLLLSYLLNISGQVNMSQQDISNLRLKLLPMIQDIVSEWLIILLFVTTPAGSTSMNDCSFKPSSLQIDSSIDKRSWNKMLGKCGFSLAYILLLSDRSCIVDSRFNLRYLPNSETITSLVQNFVSWICYSKTGEDSSSLLRRSSELTLRVVRNGHAYAVERILEVVEGSLRGEKTFGHGQDTSGDWCLLQHLRGCCLLDQVQRGACGILLREKKISDATRCFFRASSGEGSWKALHSLATEAGFSHSTIGTSISDGEKSCATWKLHYYEWAKQNFERYNISEGVCQFACAALEQNLLKMRGKALKSLFLRNLILEMRVSILE